MEKLGALGESESLAWLRAACQAMLPRIDLPELLLEVHAWTGFLDAYVHLADISTRMIDLPASLVTLLISEACNVGLTPVIKAGDEALTRGRLSHVDQNYVRGETHAAANAILIEHQGKRGLSAVRSPVGRGGRRAHPRWIFRRLVLTVGKLAFRQPEPP